MIVGHIGSGSSGGYEIQKSLRFRASASAYLSRTFRSSSYGHTFSFFVKLGSLGTARSIFGYSNGSNEFLGIEFTATGQLDFFAYSSGYIARRLTTQVFRDPSAWMHIVCVFDSANVTAGDRVRVYINGQAVTAFAASVNQAQNQYLNMAQVARSWSIGGTGGISSQYLDGYIAEFNYIEQALDPSYFGEVSAETGAWIPKKYTGTYGTNGFYLPFNDGSSLANLTADKSGNGNNWTANNISLTAGVTYDWMDDTPSNNFATLNPLDRRPNSNPTSGNLKLNNSGTGYVITRTTIFPSSGKWYGEATNTAQSDVSRNKLYLVKNDASLGTEVGAGLLTFYSNTGTLYKTINGTATAVKTQTIAVGDVLQVAYDADNGQVWFGVNGVWIEGSPSALTGASATGLTSGAYSIGGSNYTTTDILDFNFGQRPFSYAPPAGFKALCTKNLPTGTITTSGTFSGNASTDGPFVYLNGVPTAMTINGNAVTLGNHADKLANGFKVRSSSASYNSAGSNTYSITSTGTKFKYSNAQGNP